jgi:uncharacterized protein YbjT (DUF2867 family)
VILLTGATGTVGSALLRRLTAEGRPVRALVRDQRRLGDQRVRVQIALGDLADPPSFRNALRGVDTVVHLAASIRDQPLASIEELNALATLRLVRASLKLLRFATWEEAELMEEPMVSERGTADAEALGVKPLPMSAVLGS